MTPSQQFGNLFNAYSKAMNKAYGRTGSLFERPFERIEITSKSHLFHLVPYIHRNPQTHHLIADFREWPFSSYHTLCSTRPPTCVAMLWLPGLAAKTSSPKRIHAPTMISGLRRCAWKTSNSHRISSLNPR